MERQNKNYERDARWQQKITFRSISFHEGLSYANILLRAQKRIHWIRSVGLYDVWLKEEYSAIESKMIIETNRQESGKTRKEPEIERFPIPMFILYGWCLGVVALINDIIWKHLQSKQFESSTISTRGWL